MDLKFDQRGWGVKAVFNECELPISYKFHKKDVRKEKCPKNVWAKEVTKKKNLVQIHVFTREMKRSGARKLINPSTYPGYSKDFIKHQGSKNVCIIIPQQRSIIFDARIMRITLGVNAVTAYFQNTLQ